MPALSSMTLQRLAFLTELGMTFEGETPVEGPWVDRIHEPLRIQEIMDSLALQKRGLIVP